MSTSHDSDRVKDILFEAIEMAPDSRQEFLARVCEGDPDLCKRVQVLLAAHNHDQGFMKAGTSGGPRTLGPLVQEPQDVQPGDSLGRYHLIRELGEGGFGTVFLAEQRDSLKRHVAIKVLKPGMDTRHVIARFEAERHVLAMMDHPAIARVFDAGSTPAGRPYVVMEYVDGLPVTEYCDKNSLPVRARLEIFERVCAGVQHAHQRGIIHRDIKPSNILIAETDSGPEPKVIDFGIAKAIAEERGGISRLTQGLQLLGTPEYMSPEQATGATDRLDTRTDVYSLGVLLYELICGEPPFDREKLRTAGFVELERILREDVPSKPSTRIMAIDPIRLDAVATKRSSDPIRLPRILRGDLDWITLRAIEKEPDRRYPSPYALAADLRRHLNDLPVEAGPPSTLLALRKLLRRHRVAAVAAILTMSAIVIALIVTNISLYKVSQANEQSIEANKESREQLWASLLAQSRATRQGLQRGRRFASLDSLASAAAISPSLELRNEAIACFGLEDLEYLGAKSKLGLAATRGLDQIDRYAHVPLVGVLLVASLEDDRELALFETPKRPMREAVFSADGRYISAIFSGPTERITWDIQSGQRVLTLQGPDYQWNGVAFGSDASGDWQAHVDLEGFLSVHELPSGELRGRVEVGDGWNNMAATPDGSLIGVTRVDEESVVIVRTATLEVAELLEPGVSIRDLDFSDDGAFLAGAGADFNVHVWSTNDWSQTVLRGHNGAVIAIDFASDGTEFATSSWDGSVRIWNAATVRPVLGPLEGWGLRGFGDILTATHRSALGLFSFERGDEIIKMESLGDLRTFASIDLTSDGKTALIGGEVGLRLYDVASGEILHVVSESPSMDAIFNENEDRIFATFEADLHAWSWDGTRLSDLGSVVSLEGEKRLTRIAPTDLLTMTSPSGVSIIDPANGEAFAHLGMYRGLTTRPSSTPDHQYVFTGTWKGSPARVRDFATGQTLWEMARGHVIGQFSPDGSVLVVGVGSAILAYETEGWTEIWSLSRQNADDLAGRVMFSPGGEFLAVASSRYVLNLCRPENGEILASFESPGGQALGDVAFTPDASKLAVLTTQGLAHIYDLAKIRKHLATMNLDWSDPPTARAPLKAASR